MKYTQLYSSRLLLREWRESDLEPFFEYCQDPQVGMAAGWAPHEDKSFSKAVLHHFMEEGDVWAIEEKNSHLLLGSIGLHQDKLREFGSCRMLGYALGQKFWGNGYMTEAAKAVLRYAFEALCLEMVTVYHYPFNTRSQRVIEKCGFVKEGVLRKANCQYDGEILDRVCYSLLREEYFAAHGKISEKM